MGDLVLIKGENGSGKTFIMSVCALSIQDKNIYANYFIDHQNYHLLELDDLLNIPDNTDVFIDEAYLWLESRRSSSAVNVLVSQAKEQKRKTNSTWYVSEQRPKLIDKRFEEFANVIITCKSRFPIGRSKDDFVYRFEYFQPTYRVFYKRFTYLDALPYFKYFNTNEKIIMHNQDKVEFNIIKNNPHKLLKKVIELAEVLENDENTVYTHNGLKWGCLQHKILVDYEPFLYLYFKQKEKGK